MSAPKSIGRIRQGVVEGAVHHQRQPVLMGDVGDGGDVDHVQTGIADRLAVDHPRLAVDRGLEIHRIGRIDETRRNPELRQDGVEHRVGAAVKVVGRHDFIALLADVDHGVENGARPRSQGQRAGAPFQGGHPLLQHIGRGIHDPRVNVARFFEGK